MQIHYVVFFAVSSNAINVYFDMPILLNHYNDMVILNHDCDITRLLYLQLKILDVPHLDFVIFAAAEMSFNQASEWKNLTWARFENHKSSLCAQCSFVLLKGHMELFNYQICIRKRFLHAPNKNIKTGMRTRINSVDPEILIRRDSEAKSEGLKGPYLLYQGLTEPLIYQIIILSIELAQKTYT